MTNKSKTANVRSVSDLRKCLDLPSNSSHPNIINKAISTIESLRQEAESTRLACDQSLKESAAKLDAAQAQAQKNAAITKMLLDLFIISVGGTPPESS